MIITSATGEYTYIFREICRYAHEHPFFYVHATLHIFVRLIMIMTIFYEHVHHRDEDDPSDGNHFVIL